MPMRVAPDENACECKTSSTGSSSRSESDATKRPLVRDVQQTRRSKLRRLAAPKKFLLFRCWSFAIFLSNSVGNHVLVELHVSHVKAGSYRLMVHRTGFRPNDAYSAYIEMGPQRI